MLLEAPALTIDGIRALIDGDALALRVRRYLSGEVCTELTSRTMRVLDSLGRHRRIYESNAKAFTDADTDAAARAEYLRSSVATLAGMRQACEPYLWPADRLRCELDELWPSGASLLRVDTKPLVFGMIRLWRDGAGALPHIDLLQQSTPQVAEARTFTTQFGVNVYLVPPQEGNGEIEMWNLRLTDLSPELHGVDGTYGFRYDLLPRADVVLRPGRGDLVLLCSNRLHAVRPTSRGVRLSVSGFIGLQDESAPMRLWS